MSCARGSMAKANKRGDNDQPCLVPCNMENRGGLNPPEYLTKVYCKVSESTYKISGQSPIYSGLKKRREMHKRNS